MKWEDVDIDSWGGWHISTLLFLVLIGVGITSDWRVFFVPVIIISSLCLIILLLVLIGFIAGNITKFMIWIISNKFFIDKVVYLIKKSFGGEK